MRKGLVGIFIGAALSLSAPAMAEKPSFESYVAELKQEGLNKGIDAALLDSAFDGIRYRERAVKADRNQPEKRLTLDEYIPRAVPDWKVKKARRLYDEHYDDLKRIGDIYGVQPRFLVALWGVESNFGAFTGKYDVVEALTTLAYDGRREAFFRGEVFSALSILQEGHIGVDSMKGSWAGAMGQCQFMPSSFLSFAADGNNDGKKDIWNSKPDVFASSANYLKNAGWDDGYTWGRQVVLPKGLNSQLLGLGQDKAKSLAEWQSLGVRTMNKSALPDVDINAWLIQPDDEYGRAYLVYGNYQSLMRWNRSHYFAIAVSHLADRIKFG
ncbi:lytic murein transglycosylase [Enterovibrio norvegicus]|uniref:Lytic transglycosylase n=1 Tax=Enterovibrio norvegicus TaxID=188144 RepID=A0A2N7L5B2_9GAMM|nr:lytic murein transglycosylase [Enterovibrio norvegicus]PML80947.1 lytic transglycosylase [Enterovibrio norvegicus]PMN67477.1 lytic transglycosylase [Enterovibrio norvegicus]PMN88827.1 lytic transglycosylase [Enterovibrio norvegicus]